MSTTTITCDCGAKINIPADVDRRAARCPRCKLDLTDRIATLKQSATVVSSRTMPAGKTTECPICQTNIQPEEPINECDLCGQTYHQDCWQEIGGCGTYGCKNAPSSEDKAGEDAPRSGWGDTKKCPACYETIKSIALRCRYCHTDFDTVDPLSIDNLRQEVSKQKKLDSSKKSVVTIFVISTLGLLSPLMLLISLLYMLRNQERLKKSGPLFTIMGWTSVALSAAYSLLFILIILLGE